MVDFLGKPKMKNNFLRKGIGSAVSENEIFQYAVDNIIYKSKNDIILSEHYNPIQAKGLFEKYKKSLAESANIPLHYSLLNKLFPESLMRK